MIIAESEYAGFAFDRSRAKEFGDLGRLEQGVKDLAVRVNASA